MLYMPDDNIYRLLAIDPGSNTMGIALMEIDLYNRECVVGTAYTINGAQLMKNYPEIIATHGERNARLYAQKAHINNLLVHFEPHGVVCESPYMGRFPQAYAALVECIHGIRQAVMEYDSTIGLQLIDPPTAKNAVGVKARGSQKEEVGEAIRHLEHVRYLDELRLNELDEHAKDALAVGYVRVKQLLGGVPC